MTCPRCDLPSVGVHDCTTRRCARHPYAIAFGDECAMCRHERIEAESGELKTIRANAGNWKGGSYSALRNARRKGRSV